MLIRRKFNIIEWLLEALARETALWTQVAVAEAPAIPLALDSKQILDDAVCWANLEARAARPINHADSEKWNQ